MIIIPPHIIFFVGNSWKIKYDTIVDNNSSKYLNGAKALTSANKNALSKKNKTRLLLIPNIKRRKNSKPLGVCQYSNIGINDKPLITKERNNNIWIIEYSTTFLLLRISNPANNKADIINTKVLRSNSAEKGFIVIIAPYNPIITTIHLCQEIVSFKKIFDKTKTSKGIVNPITVAVTIEATDRP